MEHIENSEEAMENMNSSEATTSKPEQEVNQEIQDASAVNAESAINSESNELALDSPPISTTEPTDDSSDEETVQSEDEHDEELPEFSTMETDEMLALTAKLLIDRPISELRPAFDGVKAVLDVRFDAEAQKNLNKFIEEGGNVIDFRDANPKKDAFRKLFNEYKDKRRGYYKELESQLTKNLRAKLDLIEELKALIQKEESLSEAFDEFKSIQTRWKETGFVPKDQADDVWKTYHFHLQNFYDFAQINRDLRDLDFKKNLESKVELCEKAEKLVTVSSIKEATQSLNRLHKDWKKIGPVEPLKRDDVWDRFAAASKSIHDKRNEWIKEQEGQNAERIVIKKEIVASMANFSTEGLSSHSAWQKASVEMEEFFTKFKSLGRVNHKENDQVWEEAKNAFFSFQHLRNDYYKEVKSLFKENLEKKKTLILKATELKDSEDWKGTADKLKRIQADWKNTGQVSKKDSDKLWKEFRGVCNHFFDRMKAKNEEARHIYEANHEAKEGVYNELKAVLDSEDGLTREILEENMSKFRKLGPVPYDKKEVEEKFDKIISESFTKLKIDRKEASRLQFESKVEMLSNSGDDKGLDRERFQLRKQKEESEKEVIQLENNIQFFRTGKKVNPMVLEVQKKIDIQKDKIKELDLKLRVLRKA